MPFYRNGGTPVPSDLLVVGLGYVGLPLAHEAARSGLKVVGFDLNRDVVNGLNSGISHVGDLADPDIVMMLDRGFHAMSREDEVDEVETAVVCVPTPLTDDNGPDLTAVQAAAKMIGRLLRPGMLVVLESTTYPGTTDEVVRPILEKESGLTAGLDFALAFSPERIDPGNEHYSIRNTPKVVGGYTTSCAEDAENFYGKLCDQVVRARSAREAEMAKLLENTYRHVNIALVNEMTAFCHELGIDLWDSIRCAATKPFGFQPFYPGPGVGGHCIPIDPNYLGYKVRTLGYPFRFVELAQEINGRMPAHVVDRAAELLNLDAKALRGARVLLLGVTYKKDVADQRESPAVVIGRKLCWRGADLAYHDPYVDSWSPAGSPLRRVTDLDTEVAAADLVILLQDHSAYDLERISRTARRILDTRGRLAGANVERL
ncbi:MAG TPA: nucleotide sugar dehydrogenase [Streptosporangiaceae bacterium]